MKSKIWRRTEISSRVAFQQILIWWLWVSNKFIIVKLCFASSRLDGALVSRWSAEKCVEPQTNMWTRCQNISSIIIRMCLLDRRHCARRNGKVLNINFILAVNIAIIVPTAHQGRTHGSRDSLGKLLIINRNATHLLPWRSCFFLYITAQHNLRLRPTKREETNWYFHASPLLNHN